MTGAFTSTIWTCLVFTFVAFEITWTGGAPATTPEPETTFPTAQFSSDNDECSFLQDEREAIADECASFWGEGTPPVILVSLDGFRPEYLTRKAVGKDGMAAPTLSCLAQRGVSVPFMMPAYPTKTFPNHYSIVTGLYPESHEIVANDFYDAELNENFFLRSPNLTDPKWWRSGETIWSTIRKQEKVSATYFWPGSDVKYPDGDVRSPNYWFKYDTSTSFRKRVDQLLQWMDLPHDKRPSLATIYFEEPDKTAHSIGPNATEVTESITVADAQIRRIIDGLAERNISGCVNVIVVSDHGMADSPPGDKIVRLDKYVPDLNETSRIFVGPVVSIQLKDGTAEDEERIENSLSCHDPHMRVSNKWDLPYRMHSARSKRIPNIIADMDLHWRGVFGRESYSLKGSHGWDNLYGEMHAIFLAYGPSFKSKFVARPFENVQLYNLMCALVNVTPAENNGTWGALHHLLVDPPTDSGISSIQEFPDMPPILRMPSNAQTIVEERNACGFLNTESDNLKISDMGLNINMTEERESELLTAHAPLGIPILFESQSMLNSPTNTSNHVLLINEDYVTAFDAENGLPLWTAYTITSFSGNGSAYAAWIQDPRLEPDHVGSCQRQSKISEKRNVPFKHLFPTKFATQEAESWLDTNLLEVPAPISHLFETITELLATAWAIRGPINIISGPTRLQSSSLFFIVTACSANQTVRDWNFTTCPVEDRDLQAFLLPVGGALRQLCIADRDMIAYYVATLKDVEHVTGFNFFPDLPLEDKLNLLSRTTLDSNLILDPWRS